MCKSKLPTGRMAEVRRYFCPYCGRDYHDSAWATDHIIPAALGGPRRFAVIACVSCNGKIGREIEQPALASDTFRTALGELLISGAKVRRRRKEDHVVLKRVGLLYKNTLAKSFYDVKERKRGLEVITQPEGLTPEQFVQHKEFYMIAPADGEEVNEVQARLAAKILLGCGQWLWGERFGRSAYSTELRNRVQKGMERHEVLNMTPEEKHLTLKDDLGKEVDALDNTPHATIGIFEYEGHLLGLVNMLGGFELLVSLAKLDPSIDLGINGGVVVIAKSTENAVRKMSWDEYERFKKDHSM